LLLKQSDPVFKGLKFLFTFLSLPELLEILALKFRRLASTDGRGALDRMGLISGVELCPALGTWRTLLKGYREEVR
jgi:hypothetical protein